MAKSQWKLVRDNIPTIMEAEGKTPETRVLDDKAYTKALNKKLEEETKELKDAIASGSQADKVAELGDVLEVLAAMAKFNKIDLAVLFEAAAIKRERNGAFNKRIQLKL